MTAAKLVEIAETLARVRCVHHGRVLPVDSMRLSIRDGEVHCELIPVAGVCCTEFLDLARRRAHLDGKDEGKDGGGGSAG